MVQADGKYFVGPDNGLFEIVMRRAAASRSWAITWAPEVLSASFHGRDLFAPVAAEIATGKAYGALGFGLGSRDLHDKNPKFLAAVAAASGGKMVPVPGGVLAIDPETGDIIGAVGISGDRGENDEACAVAGIEAVSLKAEPGGG